MNQGVQVTALKAAQIIFHSIYLFIVSVMGIALLMISKSFPQFLSGVMAFVLVVGNLFYFVPRIAYALSGRTVKIAVGIGRGRQINSITLTVFYVLLWHIALLSLHPYFSNWVTDFFYFLFIVRIFLCLLPQNRWTAVKPPVFWAVARNVPFFMQGIMVCLLYFWGREKYAALHFMWLAIALALLTYAMIAFLPCKNNGKKIVWVLNALCYPWMLFMFIYM